MMTSQTIGANAGISLNGGRGRVAQGLLLHRWHQPLVSSRGD